MKIRALAIVATALVVCARSTQAANAVAYQIDVAHSGVQTDAALTPPFALKWKVTLPASVSYPLIADGLVFVTAGDFSAMTLFALDQSTGHTVWSKPVPHLSFSYPWANAAYDNGRVFVIDAGGTMTAFNAADGTVAWSKLLPFQYSFSSPPTASSGVVYVGGAGSGGTVYAVDETNGNVLATQSVENGDQSSPALSGSSVFVSYACNQDYGFARQTLAPQWHYSGPCEGGGGKTAVYENGRVFTRDFLGNLILNAANGTLLGSYNASAAPAARGNTIWVRSGSTLSAEDVSAPATPQILWSFTGDGQLVSAPIVLSTAGGDFVIEGSASGMLYALNAATGANVWSTSLGAGVQGPDEQNVSQPLTGFAAGQGLLVIPAGNTVSAFVSLPSSAIPASSPWVLALLAAALMSIAMAVLRR